MSANDVPFGNQRTIAYFNDHNVFPHLDSIIKKVLKNKPEDPEKYILQELRRWDGEESGSEYTAALLQEHAHFSFPIANKSALFNPQMLEMEQKLRGELENEKQALEYERIRAFEFVSEVIENDEAKREESTSKEINMLKKLLGLIKMEKVVVHSMNVERTIELGDKGRPLLSTSVLRFIIGFGLAGDVSQISLNALSFHSKYMKSPSAIPLNHSFRFLCEGPLHFGKLHCLHHPAAGSLLPIQAPSVCYQAVHKLLIDYALFHGKRMACEGLREEDTCRCAKQSGDLDSKGMQVVYQFHLLLRVCHMWLVTYSEPVCAWSQLLHLSLYSLIGYEGTYLTPTLIMDLGKAFEEVLLLELHSAVKGESTLQYSCNLNAQACFSWIVRESAHILSDLKTPHAKMLEGANLSQSQMTVKQLLQSVLSSTVHRPQRLEDLSLYHCVGDESSPQTLSTSSISLNFSTITEAQVKNALLTSRSSLAQFTHISELLDLFRQFEQKSISEVADHLDTLAFGERDDLAVLLSLALQCMDQERSASGLSHITKIEEIDSSNADVLFLRSKLVAAFVETIVAAQYESTVALLETSSLGSNFSASSIPSVMAKCMVRQKHRPTLFEDLLSKFKFTTVESLSTFFGLLEKIMEGKDGVAHSVFESSCYGIIFVYYPELTQVMTRYIKEMESTAVVILFTRWNRLIRYSVFSAISYAVRSQTEVIVANILERKKTGAKGNSNNKVLFRVDSTTKSEEFSVNERTSSIMVSKIDQEEKLPVAVDPTLFDVTGRLTSLEEHQISEKLFFEVQKRLHNNSDSGMFLDSIQNPITRERLSEKEGGLTVHEWDFVKLAQQIHHPGFWFHELLSKTNIMVQYDISTHELTRIATVSLQHSKDVVVAVEKAHQHEAEECKTSRSSNALSLPNEKTSKGTSSNVKRKSIDHQAIFDTVLCSFAGSSHIFGTLLYQMHSSRCPSFIFSETSSRWFALRDDQIEHIIANSLPVGVSFSSSLHEKARSRLPFCLTRLFSGEISLDNNLELILVLFRCGIMPCRFFDFFSSLQKLTYVVLRTPDAPPYFTYLTHRVLSSYLFHLDRHLDNYTRGREPMMEAWEQYLFQTCSVFEASRAMLDLIPREIMLKSDITMLREKMRLAPQKYVQMFSSQVSEKDIMSVAVWFRLHSGIPSSFLEACGVTLFDVFLSNYDQSFSVEEEVQQILRIDRAYRVILASTQPKMEDLERLQKVVVEAVAPSHKFPRRQTVVEEDRRIVSSGKAESIHEQISHGNSVGSRSSFVEVISFHGEGDLAESSATRNVSFLGYHTEDTPRQVMKFFDNLMMNDIALDEKAWRCHPLSVHLVYAITQSCIFGGSYYAEATRRFLVDLCFLLYYVKVDSYISYFFQFFMRLLIIGHPPKLLQDVTEALFKVLDALEIPFDRRMPVLLVTILRTHVAEFGNNDSQGKVIGKVLANEVTVEGFSNYCRDVLVSLPLLTVYLYRVLFLRVCPDEKKRFSDVKQVRLGAERKRSVFLSQSSTPSGVVNQVEVMVSDVLSEILLLLTQLATVIVENKEGEKVARKKMDVVVEKEVGLRALQVLALLSAGCCSLGVKLICSFGAYIGKSFFLNSDSRAETLSVWSRAIGDLTSYLTNLLWDVFDFSTSSRTISKGFPRDIGKVALFDGVLGELERVESFLNRNETSSGLYLCGSAQHYYRDIANIVYASFLDSKIETVKSLAQQLVSKLEGSNEDIVMAMCCVIPGLAMIENDQEDHLRFVEPERKVEGTTLLKESKKSVFPTLIKFCFSSVQRLFRIYDESLQEHLQLTLADRPRACEILKQAHAADLFPIPFQEGVPMTMNMFMPLSMVLVKQRLLHAILHCTVSIYVMDAVVVEQIEKQSLTSKRDAEDTKKASLSTSGEALFVYSFEKKFLPKNPIEVGKEGTLARNARSSKRLRVLPFFLYSDIVCSEYIFDVLFSSGLMSSDIMRFANALGSTMSGPSAGIERINFSSGAGATSVINHEKSLRKVWQSMLCVSSQSFRCSIAHSKLKSNKKLATKTVKDFLRIAPIIYLDMVKEVGNRKEFLEWMGQAMPVRPYFNAWLLPSFLRSTCVLEDTHVINATKRMLKEGATYQEKSDEGPKFTSEIVRSDSPKITNQEKNGSRVMTSNPITKIEVKRGDSESLLSASWSVETLQLPLSVVQDILLEIFHPKSQLTILLILQCVENNCTRGLEMKRLISRSIFFELNKQRLVRLSQRFCLLESECDELSDFWTRFRTTDKPTGKLPGTDSRSQGSCRSFLAKTLAKVVQEPEEAMDGIVLFLDFVFTTHLKSIFLWNTPTASLLALFAYIDSFEFHKNMYFLRSRWCEVAITICKALVAWGGNESEDQLLLVVRVLRGLRLMCSILERMLDPKNILSFLQNLPYQKMIHTLHANEIASLTLSLTPSTVNRAVVDKNLISFLTHISSILMSLQAMTERLQGTRGATKTIHPFDLLQLFMDWAVTFVSQTKDVTRTSCRVVALLASTAMNKFSRSEAKAISLSDDGANQEKQDFSFMQSGGVGNSVIAEQLRLFFIFSFVCSCGVRDFLKDDKVIYRSSLFEYTVREIRVILPNVEHMALTESAKSPSSLPNGSYTVLSRAFSDTCKLATLSGLLTSGPVKLSSSSASSSVELKYRESLLKVVEIVMDFVVLGINESTGSLNELFQAQSKHISDIINEEGICFADMSVICFFVSREVHNRGKMQLTHSAIQACEHLISTFCRSTESIFRFRELEVKKTPRKFSSVGLKNNNSGAILASEEEGSPLVNLELARKSSNQTALPSLFLKKSMKSVFVRTRQKLASMDGSNTSANMLKEWEFIIERQQSNGFVYSDFRIFSYVWITCMTDIVPLFRESLPFYLSSFSALYCQQSSSEELQLFVVFLHRVAFFLVQEKWITAHTVDIHLSEWIESMKDANSKNPDRREDTTTINQRLIQIASCASYAIMTSLVHKVMRSINRMKAHLSSFNLASGGPETTERCNRRTEKIFQPSLSATFQTPYTFHKLIISSYSSVFTYIVGQIEKKCKVAENDSRTLDLVTRKLSSHVLTREEVDVLKDATTAESSLIRFYKKANRRVNSSAGGGSLRQIASSSGFNLFHSPSRSSPMVEIKTDELVKGAIRKKKVYSPTMWSVENSISGRIDASKSSSPDLEQMCSRRSPMLPNHHPTETIPLPQVVDGYITLKDLAAAHTPECSWTAINGVVYDITKFVMVHPGGSHVLITACAGQDCTDAFVKKHLGNKNVIKQLEKMSIGKIR